MNDMKKILCMALCAVVLVGCDFTNKREQELTAQKESLIKQLNEKNVALEQALSSIAKIQEGFQVINEAEGRVNLQTQAAEGVTDAERMKEDILFIQQKMEENRKQMAALEKKLKASGAENANLRKVLANLQKELDVKVARIAALQAELAEKNIRIAELDKAVETLTHDVNTLQQTSDAQQDVIERQVVELNKAWYVYGTSKELKEQNILKGGDVMASSDFNKNYFTEIDVRVDRVFPLYAKHAKLLTVHPEGSYEFVKDADKQLTLKVLDIDAFWSVSRYMIIQVR
jgi:DNA repair exonuclease SbcCD ATPase subunit